MPPVRLLLFVISLASFTVFSQEDALVKYGYAGGTIIVPPNNSWKVVRAFINNSGSYNLQVGNGNFRIIYHAGDTIHLPYYIPEMELLDNKDLVQYQIYLTPDVPQGTPK